VGSNPTSTAKRGTSPIVLSYCRAGVGYSTTGGRQSGLRDADEVARGVAERAVAGAPWLGRRLLEHLGA
jgi:hypothetical protein